MDQINVWSNKSATENVGSSCYCFFFLKHLLVIVFYMGLCSDLTFRFMCFGLFVNVFVLNRENKKEKEKMLSNKAVVLAFVADQKIQLV